MGNNFDYLSIDSKDTKVLTNLSEMGEQAKKLYDTMNAKIVEAEVAKKSYEHYVNVVIPQAMAACGIESVALSSGGSITLEHKYYCQPNKNPADRAKIAKWLRQHGGGHLIEHEATVAADNFDELVAAGIPYVENTVVNTTRLKAFLKSGVAPDSGIQSFTMEDIPECIHFQQIAFANIKFSTKQQ